MTISYHALSSRKTYLLYVLGHFFGGLFFLIFAYNLFYLNLNSDLLWYVALSGVVSEWLQAFIPAKDEYEIWHLVFAWSMAFFMTVILIAAPIIKGLDGIGTTALLVSFAILVSCSLATVKVRMQKFWIPQTMYFFSFYIVMTLLAV